MVVQDTDLLHGVKNLCFIYRSTRLREVDQVSADILNEQVCWLSIIHILRYPHVSMHFGQIMSHFAFAGNQDAVFCFSLALPSPLTGCQASSKTDPP